MRNGQTREGSALDVYLHLFRKVNATYISMFYLKKTSKEILCLTEVTKGSVLLRRWGEEIITETKYM